MLLTQNNALRKKAYLGSCVRALKLSNQLHARGPVLVPVIGPADPHQAVGRLRREGVEISHQSLVVVAFLADHGPGVVDALLVKVVLGRHVRQLISGDDLQECLDERKLW